MQKIWNLWFADWHDAAVLSQPHRPEKYGKMTAEFSAMEYFYHSWVLTRQVSV